MTRRLSRPKTAAFFIGDVFVQAWLSFSAAAYALFDPADAALYWIDHHRTYVNRVEKRWLR